MYVNLFKQQLYSIIQFLRFCFKTNDHIKNDFFKFFLPHARNLPVIIWAGYAALRVIKY